MARLLLTLSLLLWSNHALAQGCYCTTGWFTTATGQGYCIANTSCWACQPGAYSADWQRLFCTGYVPPAPTCTSSFTEKTESCPANYSGIKKFKQETVSCSDGRVTVQPWQLYQDTCTPNPPTCRVSTQTRIESCQAGYTGAITQTSTSICPDPYGQPVWGSWVTSSDTCVKSITNPTNVLSPVNPISPVNPASPVSATTVPVTPSVTATVQATPVQTMTTETTPEQSPQPASESAPQSQTTSETSAAPSAASPAPATSAGSGAKAAALVQRLTLIGAMPKQPNIVEQITLKQELPDDYRRTQDFLLELVTADDAWIDPDRTACDRGFSLCGDNVFQ